MVNIFWRAQCAAFNKSLKTTTLHIQVHPIDYKTPTLFLVKDDHNYLLKYIAVKRGYRKLLENIYWSQTRRNIFYYRLFFDNFQKIKPEFLPVKSIFCFRQWGCF